MFVSIKTLSRSWASYMLSRNLDGSAKPSPKTCNITILTIFFVSRSCLFVATIAFLATKISFLVLFLLLFSNLFATCIVFVVFFFAIFKISATIFFVVCWIFCSTLTTTNFVICCVYIDTIVLQSLAITDSIILLTTIVLRYWQRSLRTAVAIKHLVKFSVTSFRVFVCLFTILSKQNNRFEYILKILFSQ